MPGDPFRLPNPPQSAPGGSKSEGAPPKSGFLGPRAVFGISPGPSKNAFWPPQGAFGGFGDAKMEPFSPKNGAGSEKRDFLEILLKPKRQLDFQGSDPPKIDPKSIPEAIRKQARKKSVKKVRGRLPKS